MLSREQKAQVQWPQMAELKVMRSWDVGTRDPKSPTPGVGPGDGQLVCQTLDLDAKGRKKGINHGIMREGIWDGKVRDALSLGAR